MIIIVDNVFNPKELEEYKKFIKSTKIHRWYHKDQIDKYSTKLIEIIDKYFNTLKVKGYEFWLHNNTRPTEGWHYDKDEYSYETNKLLRYPLCSCIFYLEVENLKGGQLNLENEVLITPKENRIVMFNQGIHHYVEDFTGTRFSININPWERKVMGR